MEYLKLICIGLVLGSTVVIPGISAGTMAIVFNVYERLIGIITPNVKKILSAWKFWLPLVIGGAAGVFFFSKAITILYENYEIPTLWFFIGIITGSLPLVYKRAGIQRGAFAQIICAVLALAVMIVMAALNPGSSSTVYSELTPQLFGILVLAGVLSAIALIIPGISGAFLLLVIGLHRTALLAVSELNIPLLIPFVTGAAAGLLIGAAFVRFLLARAPKQTYGAVLGLVAGSIIVLYPGSLGEGLMTVFSVISLLAGAAISYFFSSKNLKNT